MQVFYPSNPMDHETLFYSLYINVKAWDS